MTLRDRCKAVYRQMQRNAMLRQGSPVDDLMAFVVAEPGHSAEDYDADHFADSLTARAIKVVIPPKSNRKVKRDCDFALYCERNLVERFFNKIKHYRAIATRYDKLARNFLAAVQLVAAIILLN